MGPARHQKKRALQQFLCPVCGAPSDLTTERIEGLSQGRKIYCSFDCSVKGKPATTSYVVLKCEYCRDTFVRPKKEHDRSQKTGRLSYCNAGCFRSHRNALSLVKERPRHSGGSVRDELSAFRYLVKLMRNRRRDSRVVDVDAAYLSRLWDLQQGKCAMTGIGLELPDRVNDYGTKNEPARAASIDRIDNLKWYVEGNIQFVSRMANFARNRYSVEQFKTFIRLCFDSLQRGP